MWAVSAREQSEDFWRRIEDLSSVPEVRVLDPASGSTGMDSAPSESTAMDSGGPGNSPPPKSNGMDSRVRAAAKLEDLEAALRSLGFSPAQAKRRLERVCERYGSGVSEASIEDLIKAALRFRAA